MAVAELVSWAGVGQSGLNRFPLSVLRLALHESPDVCTLNTLQRSNAAYMPSRRWPQVE